MHRSVWRNPGQSWPVLAGLCGWLGLLVLASGPEALALCGGQGVAAIRATLAAALDLRGAGPLALEWAAMVAAMMGPLALVSLAPLVARTAPAQRAGVTVAAFGAYLLVWLAVGVLAVPVVLLLQGGWPAPLAYAPAALWLVLPMRARLMRALHRLPLPCGPSQVRQALRGGALLGARCATACLPLMIAPMAAGQGLTGMALMTHLLLSERMAARPDRRAMPIGLALLALPALLAP